jgi:Fe-S-cluster-containing dehydrogenase component/formate-dependent nitrite reductase membrane component NrfD
VTRYGFIIDQDSCIGCHACTVACKSEHDVPLGVNRTWVKYIESGEFPDTQRKFSVMRCNHCEDAPCVAVCPTTSLFKRSDGIVDFDSQACIGCKSCMNACPYDAIYIDPDTDTAAKCNYCAHKVDVGLEPSCVSVCPTQSIIAGDMDDPTTRISQVLARGKLQVRSPEQGTNPQLFYKGADQASLDPLRSRIPADGMLWADRTPGHSSLPVVSVNGNGGGGHATAGAPGFDAIGAFGPSKVAEPARTTYTTAHDLPWKWKVSAYLVTKAVAAGALMLAALLIVLGHGEGALVRLIAPGLGLAMAGATGLLLTTDLKKPGRFWYMFTGRANWRSWLVKGAVILLVYGILGSLRFLAGLLGADTVIAWLAAPAALAAAATAGYTAFLFAQCEGRDLWQTPLLLPTLLAQAVAAGAAGLLLLAPLADLAPDGVRALEWALVGGMGTALGLYLVELTARPSRNVEAAVAILTRGEEAGRFWTGVGLGVVAVALAAAGLGLVAAPVALVSLVAYEHAFVRAGQLVPLS